jgi:hypothetical protein
MGCKLAGKRRDSSDRMERRGGRFGTVAAKNLAEMAASAALRPAARAQAYPPPLAIGGRLVLAGDPTPDASVVVADGRNVEAVGHTCGVTASQKTHMGWAGLEVSHTQLFWRTQAHQREAPLSRSLRGKPCEILFITRRWFYSFFKS